jgi:hypothetical protein
MKAQQLKTIEDYFGLAAGLQAPWRVSKCSVNDINKTLHLWVTTQAALFERRHSWFGMKTVLLAPKSANAAEKQWRHLDCMDYAVTIHTTDTLEPEDYALDWFGPASHSFTNRMGKKIFLLLMEGMDLQQVCDIQKIPFADVWKFKYELDNGLLHFEYTPSVKRKRTEGEPVPSELPVATEGQTGEVTRVGVPEMSDPVWEQLINGTLNIQIRTLSFQLLLTKLRQQVSLLESPDVKIMKLRELHRYVERHERVLAHELTQLKQL